MLENKIYKLKSYPQSYSYLINIIMIEFVGNDYCPDITRSIFCSENQNTCHHSFNFEMLIG